MPITTARRPARAQQTTGSGSRRCSKSDRSSRPRRHPAPYLAVQRGRGVRPQRFGARSSAPTRSRGRWNSLINIDARGVSGPALMFETSEPNGAALSIYARGCTPAVRQFAEHRLFAVDPQQHRRRRVQARPLDAVELRNPRQRNALSLARRHRRCARPRKPLPCRQRSPGGEPRDGGIAGAGSKSRPERLHRHRRPMPSSACRWSLPVPCSYCC